jgi:hypothetical protein
MQKPQTCFEHFLPHSLSLSLSYTLLFFCVQNALSRGRVGGRGNVKVGEKKAEKDEETVGPRCYRPRQADEREWGVDEDARARAEKAKEERDRDLSHWTRLSNWRWEEYNGVEQKRRAKRGKRIHWKLCFCLSLQTYKCSRKWSGLNPGVNPTKL